MEFAFLLKVWGLMKAPLQPSGPAEVAPGA